MLNNNTFDDLETDYGTAILSELTGQSLSRNQQPVRLFDQTRHTAEYYYQADERGKPYVQDHQNNVRHYPVTAYCQVHKVDYATALADLTRQYGIGKTPGNRRPRPLPLRKPSPPPRPVDYLPVDAYERCRTRFERNGLYEYLRFRFGQVAANEAFARYRLGTSKRWEYLGYLATCLPQFDVAGNLRQVKIMPFDAMSGRRVKKHQAARQWNAHSQTYEPTKHDLDKTCFAGEQIARDAGIVNIRLQQCYFGEHLLPKHPDAAVALFEGESTAIICSIVRPHILCLATGGKSGAGWTNPETFSVLAGRDVVIWPDNDAYTDWLDKAKPLRKLVKTLKVTAWVKEFVKEHVLAKMDKADLRDILMLPRYTPVNDSPVFGEPLSIELYDHYPPDWDTMSNQTPPTLITSPRQDEYAELLHVAPGSLHLYQIKGAV